MGYEEELDAQVEEHAQLTPGGLTIAKRKILRAHIERGDRDNNKDYTYGWDEGESKQIKN